MKKEIKEIFRVGCITGKGDIISQNFQTFEDAESWIIEQLELDPLIKKAVIENKKTKERQNVAL